MDTTDGYDPAVWSQMADQLGLQSLTIPEEFGGLGFTYVELLVVLEEWARLLCAPFFSSVALGANALLTSGDEAAKKYYLPGIASGETIATLAFTEENGRWDSTASRWGQARRRRLGARRHQVLRPRRSHGQPDSRGRPHRRRSRLFAVAGDADGLTRTPLPTMDQTRKQARLEFAATPARLVGEEGGAPGCRRRSTSPPWRWPPSRSAVRSACST